MKAACYILLFSIETSVFDTSAIHDSGIDWAAITRMENMWTRLGVTRGSAPIVTVSTGITKPSGGVLHKTMSSG
jgi:hypothetical protein